MPTCESLAPPKDNCQVLMPPRPNLQNKIRRDPPYVDQNSSLLDGAALTEPKIIRDRVSRSVRAI